VRVKGPTRRDLLPPAAPSPMQVLRSAPGLRLAVAGVAAAAAAAGLFFLLPGLGPAHVQEAQHIRLLLTADHV
jgi:hypothetical protein